MSRPIYRIAQEIDATWKNVSIHARPYLSAMYHLSSGADKYGLDDGKGIVLYFLSNASGFRGDAARRLKKELRDAIK